MGDTFMYMELLEQLEEFNISVGAIGGGVLCMGIAFLLALLYFIFIYEKEHRK